MQLQQTSHTASLTIHTDSKTHDRILHAYETDTKQVSKQPIDFSQWAIDCLLDWAEAVEIEAARNE